MLVPERCAHKLHCLNYTYKTKWIKYNNDNNNYKESPWNIHSIEPILLALEKTFTVIERSSYAYNSDTKNQKYNQGSFITFM